MKNSFVAFLLAGGLCFAFELVVFYLLVECMQIDYLLSSATAFILATLINYILCQRYVFVGAKNGVKQLVLFVTTSIVGLGINQLCMWLFVECVAMHYLLAKIFATAIVTIWNYITKRMALR